ncbi:MAG TPA: hypothetical protein VFU06_01300, partial [Longimicrobiales bacterium]|nr:hypothetical protein [Longimicrobiales bacterium]
MSRRLDIVRRLTCIAVMLTASACADDHALTAPDTRDEVDEPPSSPQSTVGHGIFDERAHALSAADFTLLSSPEELTSGHYRFRALTDEVPVLERDDFIVLDDADGTKQVRRVLGATTQGDELVLETGHAYLHEIIREGSYTLTVPLGGPGAARFSSPEAATISVGPTRVDLPPLEGSFDDYDVCAVLHDVLALIPGPREIEVCGKYVEMEVAYGVSVGIAGRLDSLRILDGNVRLTGDADIGLTMDAGGISGGRPPVFYPCNRGAYPGCLKTPTGANLIDFLRQYAPAIPEASLAPVRVCVPGTPVRTRAGYWSGLRWTPPVFVRCRIEDIGQLPTVILPSLAAAFTEVRPRLQGEMTVRAVGDGKFTLEVPIPSLAYKAGYQVTNDFKAMAAIGVFIKLQATLNNGGATVKLMFDDTGRLTQTWSGQAGWEQDFELVDRNNHAQLLDLTNPDSTVIRVSAPVKVKVEACVAIWSCGEPDEPGKPDLEAQMTVLDRELFKGFNLGVEAGVGVSMLEDLIYTRDQ